MCRERVSSTKNERSPSRKLAIMWRPANVAMYHSLVQKATVYAYFAADDVLFGGETRSPLRRLNQRDQLVTVMFELLVADAGDAAELCERGRARRRDAVDG
jgi:hypothetical protein